MKGQAHSFDFTFAVLVFLIVIAFFISTYSNMIYSYDKDSRRRDMETHSMRIVENLIRTPGIPEGWEKSVGPAYTTNADTKGLWHFDENSGSIASDSSANNNNGTIYNDGSISEGDWVEGQFGSALNFDTPTLSQPDKIEIPASSGGSLDIHGSLTLEAWVKPASVSGKQGIIVRNFHSALWIDGGKANFGVDGFSGFKSVQSSSNILSGEWTHVAGIYDNSAGVLMIYINGELDNSSSGSVSTWYSNSNPFVIGNSRYAQLGSDHCCPFDGVIEEVRISSKARDSSELNSKIQTPVSIGFSEWYNNIWDTEKVDAFFNLDYDAIKTVWGIGGYDFELGLIGSGRVIGSPPNENVSDFVFIQRFGYYNNSVERVELKVWEN